MLRVSEGALWRLGVSGWDDGDSIGSRGPWAWTRWRSYAL